MIKGSGLSAKRKQLISDGKFLCYCFRLPRPLFFVLMRHGSYTNTRRVPFDEISPPTPKPECIAILSSISADIYRHISARSVCEIRTAASAYKPAIIRSNDYGGKGPSSRCLPKPCHTQRPAYRLFISFAGS